MNKIIIEEYRISENKVTHMKLKTLSLSENQTLSMVNKYRFDRENTEKMINEAEYFSEQYRINQEQREYEEMNYDAIYRHLSDLSTLELLKKLLKIK